MKKIEKIILDTDPEAAVFKTFEGWVSRNGRFYGKDERAARYDGCTHHTCTCGKIANKGYTLCIGCINKRDNEDYSKLPFKEFDNFETPVFDRKSEKYFFDGDDLSCYLEDNELTTEDLQLVYCVPVYFNEIQPDYWGDVLPEEGDLPEELYKRLKEFNKFLETLPPACWIPSKTRTNY